MLELIVSDLPPQRPLTIKGREIEEFIATHELAIEDDHWCWREFDSVTVNEGETLLEALDRKGIEEGVMILAIPHNFGPRAANAHGSDGNG